MESPGKHLKAERELRNLSLEEIAKFTKIRENFLRAIEEDRYELLPPAVYVKGFLTIYAKYLDLDPYDVVLRYQNYLKSFTIPQPLELQKQIPPPKKKVKPLLIFFLIFATILFVALLIYYPSRDPSERFHLSFEEESTSIPSPSIPSPLPSPGMAEPQITNQAVQKEISRLKEEETKDVPPLKSPIFEVLEASMGTRIEREGGRLILIGKCSKFTCNNQRAYFFTRIKTPRERKIAHVWLWEGKEFHRIEIEVKPPAWSVYSYISLSPQRAGSWKAEIKDGDNVLKSLSFKATKADSYSIQEQN